MIKFWIDCLFATLFIFLSMWGINRLTHLNVFNAFDSIGQALNDVELTDYVFSGLRDDPNVDERIVVVNIGNLSRRQVAQELKIISKYKPKVIGIDSFFDCQTKQRDTVDCPELADVLGNLMLGEAIKEAKNVVLVTKVLASDSLLNVGAENAFDSLEQSDPAFRDGAYGEGFANLETDANFQDDVKTSRSFNPRIKVGQKDLYAFSVRMAMLYDSSKTKKFLARNNFSEIINYRGNVMDIFHQTNYPQMFYTLDVEDVLTENFVPGVIEGKVVIFGYLGQQLGDPSWNDKFFTPLNKKLAGKANPDMFGAVVHANIVSMILNEDYVNQMPSWQEYTLAFILCMLNVALFSLINTNLPLWYDGITKLIQLIQLLVFTVLMVLIFHWYNFKLNITVTLVAIALVGDVYEIYTSVIKNVVFKITENKGFTRKNNNVLTPDNPK